MKIDHIVIPPLKKVIIELSFENDIELKVSDISGITAALEEHYSVEPNLLLLPRIIPGQEIKFPIGGDLRYSDAENEKILRIGKDFLVFTYTKYDNWEILRAQLIKSLMSITNTLNLKEISEVKITYINEFKIKKDPVFIFKDNFNITTDIPKRWDLHYHDFFLGIVPFENDEKKIVLRLRGVGLKDENFVFVLETSFISKNLTLRMEGETLKQYLTMAHDEIEIYFIELLEGTELKKQIGMFLENE